jgi:hypothetical protein
MDAATARLAWLASTGPANLPLGAATATAWTAVQAVAAKLDDFFARARLARFDARANALVNRQSDDLARILAGDLGVSAQEMAALPVARVSAEGRIDFTQPLNPAWEARLLTLRESAVAPILGDATQVLDLAGWQRITATLAPYGAWLDAEAGKAAAACSAAELEDLLGRRAALQALIERDLLAETEHADHLLLDRLLRYRRHLPTLLRNFVNFRDFYRRTQPPVFFTGVLYLDQRSYDACLPVEAIDPHAALASRAGMYLMYCTCTRPGGLKRLIVVAATRGDADYLMVGRNGIFYDRMGNDWDATITKIVDHPISIQQAFWSPYKKIGKMISDTVEKMAGKAEKSVLDSADQTLQGAAAGTPPKPPAKIDVGMLAAIGLIASSLAGVVTGLFATLVGMPLWQLPLVVVGVILAISGPSMILAYLKLRKRTLGPILEAGGWAINGRVRITLPLANTLTAIQALPATSRRDPTPDPYAEAGPWGWYLLLGGLLTLTLAAYLIFSPLVLNRVTWTLQPVPEASATAATVGPESPAP